MSRKTINELENLSSSDWTVLYIQRVLDNFGNGTISKIYIMELVLMFVHSWVNNILDTVNNCKAIIQHQCSTKAMEISIIRDYCCELELREMSLTVQNTILENSLSGIMIEDIGIFTPSIAIMLDMLIDHIMIMACLLINPLDSSDQFSNWVIGGEGEIQVVPWKHAVQPKCYFFPNRKRTFQSEVMSDTVGYWCLWNSDDKCGCQNKQQHFADHSE